MSAKILAFSKVTAHKNIGRHGLCKFIRFTSKHEYWLALQTGKIVKRRINGSRGERGGTSSSNGGGTSL